MSGAGKTQGLPIRPTLDVGISTLHGRLMSARKRLDTAVRGSA